MHPRATAKVAHSRHCFFHPAGAAGREGRRASCGPPEGAAEDERDEVSEEDEEPAEGPSCPRAPPSLPLPPAARLPADGLNNQENKTFRLNAAVI